MHATLHGLTHRWVGGGGSGGSAGAAASAAAADGEALVSSAATAEAPGGGDGLVSIAEEADEPSCSRLVSTLDAAASFRTAIGAGASSCSPPAPWWSPLWRLPPGVLAEAASRGRWLLLLLLLQSLSSFILDGFENLLRSHLAVTLYLTMCVGAGGNAGAFDSHTHTHTRTHTSPPPPLSPLI
jgi:hypothetical protein